MNIPQRVYLNGQFLPAASATIPVFDRGFIFGDGVYEVIPVYGGRLFRLPHHLQRLDMSLAAIGMRQPMSHAQWAEVLERVARENDEGDSGDQSVYLQVTRGVAPRDHAYPKNSTPTVFAYAQPLTYPEPAQLQQGVTAVTVPDLRWSRCDIKAIALLPNVMMRQHALERGAAEAILIRDGIMTEGAASNIFIVEAGRLITPPKGLFILPGITRDLVVELASAHDIPCTEETISEERLRAADEVWMTSSTKEIMPIVRIDDQPVGNGRPGPVHTRMHALYQDYKRAFRAGAVD
jgi:D-alanine transaminase